LKADPKSAVAAYNLGVILARERIEEAIALCRKAAELRPDEPKYAYTLAFYLRQSGRAAEAIATLQEMLGRHPAQLDGLLLLGETLEQQGRRQEAIELYRRAIANEQISAGVRDQLAARIQMLSSP
jgi:tetratricopeptide (TPR) repeat protein